MYQNSVYWFVALLLCHRIFYHIFGPIPLIMPLTLLKIAPRNAAEKIYKE